MALEMPKLFSVLPAPSTVQWVSVEPDGDLKYSPVKYIGFSNVEIPNQEQRCRPVTRQWYTNSDFFWVEPWYHATERNGRCSCGWPECTKLGVIDTSNQSDLEHLRRNARKRQEWLAKLEARRAKQRAYESARREKVP